MLSIGSLFSGIGGLELGLERAGLGPVLWQAERDPYCLRVLARHWPSAQRFTDVREVMHGHAAHVGLVCGGFPCQPVSYAGKRRAQRDERWLWPELARIVRELEPAIVVAENVLGLRTAGLPDVLSDLAALRFDAEWTCLSAADLGAPHLRRRIFIVATHPDRVRVRLAAGWLGRATALAAHAGEARALADAVSIGRLADQAARDARGVDPSRRERDGAWSAQAALALGGDQDALADADGARLEGADGSGLPGPVQRARRAGSRGAPPDASAADADAQGQPQPPWRLAEERGWASDSGWRKAPPAIRGVDDGLCDGLDGASDKQRIAALGNAVVPQCAELIGRALLSAIELSDREVQR